MIGLGGGNFIGMIGDVVLPAVLFVLFVFYAIWTVFNFSALKQGLRLQLRGVKVPWYVWLRRMSGLMPIVLVLEMAVFFAVSPLWVNTPLWVPRENTPFGGKGLRYEVTQFWYTQVPIELRLRLAGMGVKAACYLDSGTVLYVAFGEFEGIDNVSFQQKVAGLLLQIPFDGWVRDLEYVQFEFVGDRGYTDAGWIYDEFLRNWIIGSDITSVQTFVTWNNRQFTNTLLKLGRTVQGDDDLHGAYYTYTASTRLFRNYCRTDEFWKGSAVWREEFHSILAQGRMAVCVVDRALRTVEDVTDCTQELANKRLHDAFY